MDIIYGTYTGPSLLNHAKTVIHVEGGLTSYGGEVIEDVMGNRGHLRQSGTILPYSDPYQTILPTKSAGVWSW
ncbi:MAG: hypothetical protein F4Z11_00800 [Cenarchaeum sp. SB0666_bin_15]|nr:hypothetical protein [Cenarchaeum sp. SB0664_bin_35]MXZ93035.1 hypothetical protein [Cenarchaeum sp. SB0666_bin_15]MYB46468.1 hypothetical protein [Cenarchaeum sp. SB0662_bin_33]MYG32681.1 hypothetical protein [Cenarchaeum sp. SB0677_bin_16]